MRVLLVDPSNYTPYYDYQLCRALRDSGCYVELLTSRFIYETLPFAEDPGTRYHFHHLLSRMGTVGSSGRSARPLRQLAKAIEYPYDLLTMCRHLFTVRPDVVHYQWLVAPHLDVLVARLARRLGCRVIHTIHNVRPHDGNGPKPALYSYIYENSDALIVHSQSAKRELAGIIGGTEGKISVIPHGSLFTEQARLPKQEARRQLGLPAEAKLVLFFGLIEPYKGIEYLFRALAATSGTVPDVRLVVAGKTGIGWSTTKGLLASLGIAEKVILRLGFVPSGEVAAYFSSADVVALPYLSATQSGVLLTAYTFGRPVVVTRTGALGETVAADGTGYVVEAADAQGLASALQRMLSNSTIAEHMGIQAMHLSRTRYGWQQIAAQTIAVYRAKRGDGVDVLAR